MKILRALMLLVGLCHAASAADGVLGTTNGTTTLGAGPSGGGTQVYSNQTVTVAGTANQVTSSAAAQDLTVNRTWTLSFPNAMTLPGTLTLGGDVNAGGFQLTNVGSWTNIYITSDQATTSTTASNMTSLFWNIGANEVWSAELHSYVTCSTANGAKFAIAVPSGATVGALVHLFGGTATPQIISASATLTSSMPTAADNALRESVLVQNGATPGTVQFQFASTDGVNIVTVKGNKTYIVARRIK